MDIIWGVITSKVNGMAIVSVVGVHNRKMLHATVECEDEQVEIDYVVDIYSKEIEDEFKRMEK